MKYAPLGRSGIQASVVGLGTWVMGGGTVWGGAEDRDSERAIHAALDAGVTLIDTAPAYGWGRSEEVVGRALKGRRDRAVIATKCGLWWDDARGSFFADFDGKKMYRCLRPETIEIEVGRSLRRLRTDYLDLYQTHWPAMPPEATPIADTMACLLQLRQQGKIRAIGVSNVSLAELEEYGAHGEVASDQFRYSMLHRAPERDILPFCHRHQIATLTYMSLEQGLLTGKVTLDRAFTPGDFRTNAAWNPWFLPGNRRRVLDLLASWAPLAGQYRCSLAQLVGAWTLAQTGVTHLLCGARTQAQAMDNVAAADLIVAPGDLERIRRDVEALGEPET